MAYCILPPQRDLQIAVIACVLEPKSSDDRHVCFVFSASLSLFFGEAYEIATGKGLSVARPPLLVGKKSG